MIDFIYGTAGSGKSTLVYNRILADAKQGEKVILLVPEQQVLSCERELAQLDGTGIPINVQVLSFRRLANTVFRAEGGLRYDYVTKGQKTVLLWRAMLSVAPALKKYNALTLRDRNFLTEMVGCMEEFKAYRVTPALLEKAAENIPDSQKEFKSKVTDLALAYSAYTETLSHGYNDPSDDPEALLGILECSDYLNDYKVYIDSFNGYTTVEFDIIRHIFEKAKGVCITLCYDRTDGPAFMTVKEVEKRLKEIAKNTNDIILTDTPRFKNKELQYLSKNIWDFSKGKYEGENNSIRLFTTHDIYTECEFIARDISRRIRLGKDAGVRYHDFAVIVRNIDSYDGILNAMFEKYDIPHFLSTRTDITLHPAVKCILSALAIGIGGWQTDDVFSYIKCGFAGICPDECNELENYVQTWGITGKRWCDEYRWNMNPAGYTEELSESDAALLTRVNELRTRLSTPLLNLFGAFNKDTTVREATEAVWSFIREIDLRGQLDEGSASIWNALLSALDGMVRCAADMTATPDIYRDLLFTLLREADVGKIPEGNDQVTIGDASLLRLHNVENVYIPGVLEGEFPQNVGDGSILTDSEKTVLSTLGVKLSAGTATKNSDELFYLWRAVSAPRSSLTVTYPMATLSGEALTPSIAVTRLNALFFPDEEPINADDCLPEERIEGYDSSFEFTSLYKGTDLGKVLYDIYSADESYSGRIAALDFSVQNTDCSISEENAEKIWKKDIRLSQSRLDKFNNCAFSYYCTYVLGLKEEQDASFSVRDIGSFVHMLLERFMQKICEGEKMRLHITEEEKNEIIDNLIDDYICAVFRDRRTAPARLLTLVNRLRRTALLLISEILAEFSQSDFRPKFFELNIGYDDDGSLPSYVIDTPNGCTVSLRGKVDRVDTYQKGEDVYVRIIDYKSGSKDIKLADIEKGHELQMLLYLFAIWKTNDAAFIKRIGAENGEIKPAGVQYYKVKMPDLIENSQPDKDTLISSLYGKVSRTGLSLSDSDIIEAANRSGGRRYTPGELITLEHFGELVNQVEDVIREITGQMRSGAAKAEWKNTDLDECKYCTMQPICRKGWK